MKTIILIVSMVLVVSLMACKESNCELGDNRAYGCTSAQEGSSCRAGTQQLICHGCFWVDKSEAQVHIVNKNCH